MGFGMLQSRVRVTRIIKYAGAYSIGVGACQGEELPFFCGLIREAVGMSLNQPNMFLSQYKKTLVRGRFIAIFLGSIKHEATRCPLSSS